MSLATIVDTSDLLEVVYTAFIAGVGVTGAYGAAILGAGRALDHGRDGRPVAALAYGALGVVSTAIVVAAVLFGIVTMIDK